MKVHESLALLGAAFLVAVLAVVTNSSSLAYAQAAATSTGSLQSQINAQNNEITQLNAEIAQYETEIQSADANKQTLQSAINALNLQVSKVKTQVSATQKEINVTQLKIQQLGTGISTTQAAINANQAALGENIRSLAETDDQPLILQILSATGLSQAWNDADQILQVQNGMQEQVATLEGQKATLATSQAQSQAEQTTLTAQKQSLSSQQQSLTQTEGSKTQLLAETNAQESTYEKLLATAQAELSSFSTFATNAGGSGLLTNQTSCDSWGCYYNQRDSAWGNDALNGTKYLLKSDGCLITAMAMVLTHYGYTDVTPVTINSNPGNFAAYYPAYLLYTINVDGVSATRKTAAIDATLATGTPVIVGIYAYGGTHFIVFVSGSKGHYVMRDPYVPNGDDVNFTSYYSLNDIFSAAKVVVTS